MSKFAFRQYDLPQLQASRLVGTGERRQVVFPHPEEHLSRHISVYFKGSALLEIFIPSHRSMIVIVSEIMPVLHYEKVFKGFADLLDRGNTAIVEYIFVEPRFSGFPGNIISYRMQQE